MPHVKAPPISIARPVAAAMVLLSSLACGARSGLFSVLDVELADAGGDAASDAASGPMPGADASSASGVVELALGGDHTCARLTDGRVKCWGSNFDGEIGDGTTIDRSVPTEVVGLAGTVQLSMGGLDHSCARLSDGTIRCWGSGSYGQIGDGAEVARTVPTSTAGLTSRATQISLGSRHTCALRDDGAMSCWGRNLEGELGDGTEVGRPLPETVSTLPAVAEIALGYSFTCARLRGDGEVSCWGMNSSGALGDGTTNDHALPAAVKLPAPAISVAAGGEHACARLVDGRVMCWGGNESGQLGDGTMVQRESPVEITSVEGFATIVLGLRHSCGLSADGTVACWGNNSSGQLGDGTTIARVSPTPVDRLADVVEIALGGFHTCARVKNGSVMCWGANLGGELGDGTTIDRHSPTAVAW
jgi:alpha-tubulin suppressor-like RCC1 family protein